MYQKYAGCCVCVYVCLWWRVCMCHYTENMARVSSTVNPPSVFLRNGILGRVAVGGEDLHNVSSDI